MHYPTFFCPVQTLCNLVPRVSSLFNVNIKKQKDPGEELGPYTFIQDLHWVKGWGSCFECGLFINFGTIILFKRSMTEKDVCLPHRFISLDCSFSFCTDFFNYWWLCKVKKKRINKAVSKQSYYFFIFWFQVLNFKTQFKIEFWPPVNWHQLVLQ